jgi:predicted RNA-binding Zn-ribbon protein involved in translation (DUF1610 family)
VGDERMRFFQPRRLRCAFGRFFVAPRILHAMHCFTCGYALWNLTEPRCPECGREFDLREYRFVPGTVAFACPLCGGLHQGSGDAYLPGLSDTVRCQACGEMIETRRMMVAPLVDDPQTAIADPLPWVDRKRLGLWRAWWKTAVMGMVSPGKIGQRIGFDGNFSDAYKFALMTFAVTLTVQVVCVGILLSLVIVAFAGVNASSGNPPDMLVLILIMWAIMIGSAVLGSVLGPLLIAGIQGGCAHLFLRVTGPIKRNFSVTAQAILYAHGPVIWMGIPICGWYLGFAFQIWALVASILVLMRAQAVGGVRATFALLWLPLVFLALYIALIVAMQLSGNWSP